MYINAMNYRCSIQNIVKVFLIRHQCDKSIKDDEHISSFLPLIDYSHGGKRESIEDEKHSIVNECLQFNLIFYDK
jgi:hypothetical protein